MTSDRNPRNSRPVGISTVLQAFFEDGKSELSKQFLRWKLWRKWSEYAGATIAECSEPVAYHNGILYIWVKNSSWMQQMVFMREPLKNSLNSKLGTYYVRDIRLTLDRRSVPTLTEDASELKEAVKKISQEE